MYVLASFNPASSVSVLANSVLIIISAYFVLVRGVCALNTKFVQIVYQFSQMNQNDGTLVDASGV